MPHQQVTRAQLRQFVQNRVESSAYWTDTEANNAINEALRVWNMLTGVWKTRVNLTTVANQVWYSTPATMLYNTRLSYQSTPLDPTSLFDLDNGIPGWETATGTPGIWTPAGLTLLAIYPADSVGGSVMTLDGVAATPTLSGDVDYVNLSQAELGAITSYCLHYLSFKGDLAAFQTSIPFMQLFVQQAAEVNQRLKASNFFRKYMGLSLDKQQRPARVPSLQQAS